MIWGEIRFLIVLCPFSEASHEDTVRLCLLRTSGDYSRVFHMQKPVYLQTTQKPQREMPTSLNKAATRALLMPSWSLEDRTRV